MNTLDKIRGQLEAGLKPQHLEVQDDSGRHRGHAGAGGGGHYQVLVVAEAFVGKGLVERHRMIQELLRELFKSEVHALAMQTLTPQEWAARRPST